MPFLVSRQNAESLISVIGKVPSAINPPKGCRFYPRYEKCMDICKTLEPEAQEVDDRLVSCHLFSWGATNETVTVAPAEGLKFYMDSGASMPDTYPAGLVDTV